MVNIYLLYCSNDSIPDGWTEISSTYRNRLIKITSSGFLSTGGAATHTHTINSGFDLGNSSTINNTKTGTTYVTTQAHTHEIDTSSLGTASNIPYYKNYRLIYKDYSTLTSFPANSACIMGSLPSSGWEWDESEDCFIRIASSYGSKGGSNSHYHTYTASWYSFAQESSVGRSAGTGVNVQTAIYHAHGTQNINTDSQDFTYKYWGGGVCKAVEDANVIPANSYCFFDSTPPTGWTSVSSTGALIKNLADRTIATGGDDNSHTHTLSGTIGSSSGSSQACVTGGSLVAIPRDHTHPLVNGSFSNTLPIPSCFTLGVAYNVNQVLFPTTRSKTFNIDSVLLKHVKKTYKNDFLLKKKVNSLYYLDFLLVKRMTNNIQFDMFLNKRYSNCFDVDAFLLKTNNIDLILNMLVSKVGGSDYFMGLKIQGPTQVKCYINTLLQKKNSTDYTLSLILARMEKYHVDLLAKKSCISQYQMSINIRHYIYERTKREIKMDKISPPSPAVEHKPFEYDKDVKRRKRNAKVTFRN